MPRNWMTTFWWAIPNLVVPLLAIPVVVLIQWMSRKSPSWQAVVEDGQLCFYSIAILAAAWYDLKELTRKGEYVGGMDSWIFLVGLLATLAYGIMASDHIGAKTLSRDRAAVVSVAVALASIGLALQVHSMVAAH
jgi:hypothetical protein